MVGVWVRGSRAMLEFDQEQIWVMIRSEVVDVVEHDLLEGSSIARSTSWGGARAR